MNQMVISKVEEDILACSLKKYRNQLNEILDCLEQRDFSTAEIKESLKNLEDRLRNLRKNAFLARP